MFFLIIAIGQCPFFCTVSKVRKHFLHNKCITIKNSIAMCQFSFLRKCYTFKHVLTFLASIYEWCDWNTQMDVIDMAFLKAFNRVPHNKLGDSLSHIFFGRVHVKQSISSVLICFLLCEVFPRQISWIPYWFWSITMISPSISTSYLSLVLVADDSISVSVE